MSDTAGFARAGLVVGVVSLAVAAVMGLWDVVAMFAVGVIVFAYAYVKADDE